MRIAGRRLPTARTRIINTPLVAIVSDKKAEKMLRRPSLQAATTANMSTPLPAGPLTPLTPAVGTVLLEQPAMDGGILLGVQRLGPRTLELDPFRFRDPEMPNSFFLD